MRRGVCEGGARLSINNNSHDQDEAQIILDALREIQTNPELQAQAEKDPESVLNRLGLSDIARHAVAAGLVVMLATPVVMRPAYWF